MAISLIGTEVQKQKRKTRFLESIPRLVSDATKRRQTEWRQIGVQPRFGRSLVGDLVDWPAIVSRQVGKEPILPLVASESVHETFKRRRCRSAASRGLAKVFGAASIGGVKHGASSKNGFSK